MNEVLLTTKGLCPDLTFLQQGKVRDVYDLEKQLLIVSTDRISAFDWVLPNGIDNKGAVLNSLSAFWFLYTETETGIPNHLVTTNSALWPKKVRQYADILAGRSMLVKKAKRIDLECVVRGYLAGSAWSDYKKTGLVCGHRLPAGLREADKLPEPIFTPSTKAESGHDENISVQEASKRFGADIVYAIMTYSIKLYKTGAAKAESCGLILADTKFEFGFDEHGQLIVIDEMLTPDSSRYWPLDEYEPGMPQNSFDKQYVRDYLQHQTDWDKNSPPPALPDEVVWETTRRYLNLLQMVTGRLIS